MRAASKAQETGKDLTRAALCFCACNLLAAALAAQCPSPVGLTPDQNVTSGTNTWRSNGSFKATNYTVSGSASVTFVSGQCIELAPNFHATGTAPTPFHAWVDALPTVSASPRDVVGTSGQITWTGSSPYGYGYLTTLIGDIGNSFTAMNSCFVIFNASSNVLQLADNTGSYPQANSMTLPSTGMIGNSQCTIYGAGSSVSRAGNQLALTVSVTFQPTYAGLLPTKTQYLWALDQAGLSSDVQAVGTWTLPSAQQYSLTTSVSPSGSGTLTFIPPCCTYNAGTLVTITASAASGYQISSFTGVDSSNVSTGYVTMNGTRSVTASFTQTATSYLLTTSVSPSGTGTISPATGFYNAGPMTVTATANSGYAFSNFTGTYSGTTRQLSINLSATGTITANFVPGYAVSGRVTLSGSGTGVSGVNVSASGSQSGSTITDANGSYSLPGLAAGGSYTVSASKSGYALSAPQSFANLAANQTASFTATPWLSINGGSNNAEVSSSASVSLAFNLYDQANGAKRIVPANGMCAHRPSRETLTYASIAAAPRILLTGSPQHGLAALWDRIRNCCPGARHNIGVANLGHLVLSCWMDARRTSDHRLRRQDT